jgi:hypothetical protein
MHAQMAGKYEQNINIEELDIVTYDGLRPHDCRRRSMHPRVRPRTVALFSFTTKDVNSVTKWKVTVDCGGQICPTWPTG